LHFTVNDCGDILSFCLTRGHVDDRTPVPYLAKQLIGKLFGDRGYLSQKLTDLLATQDVELITTLKKNMKPRVIAAFDKLILRKRSIIETINDQLKNIFSLEHSRHRSLINFLVNAIPVWSPFLSSQKTLFKSTSAAFVAFALMTLMSNSG